MYRKLVIILAILLVVGAMTTTVFAGRTPRIREVGFSLGSLIADGFIAALANENAFVTLEAEGTAVVTCVNPGSQDQEPPGQNTQVSGTGRIVIPPEEITHNGTAPFTVAAEASFQSAREAGCPNDNWEAKVDFVYWEKAIITIEQTDTSAVFNFTCVTTRDPDTVSCTADQ